MNLNQQEKYILCTYENRSITKAAVELGISQPALSSAINVIERKLGFRIFERKKSPIAPTPEGQVYIEYLKKSQQEYRECFARINDLIENQDRRLSLGAPAAYAGTYLPELMIRFNREYPRCKITVKVATLPELTALSEEGSLDCFISTSGELAPHFIIERIKTEKIYLCIPKQWPVNEELKAFQTSLGAKAAAGPAEQYMDWSRLEGLELISLGEKQPLQREINEFLSMERLTLNSRFTVDQVSVGIELAAQGLGLTFASEEAIRGCRTPDNLCLYALPEYIADRNIYVAYNGNYYVSRMCGNFISMIKNCKGGF